MIFELVREMTDEEEKTYRKVLKKDSQQTGITLWKVNIPTAIEINLYKEEEKLN